MDDFEPLHAHELEVMRLAVEADPGTAISFPKSMLYRLIRQAEVAYDLAQTGKQSMIEKCGDIDRCRACKIEKIGCACDGAFDDGCFLCCPAKHERPECPPKSEYRRGFEDGLAEGRRLILAKLSIVNIIDLIYKEIIRD
jgi:hypothetical protein